MVLPSSLAVKQSYGLHCAAFGSGTANFLHKRPSSICVLGMSGDREGEGQILFLPHLSLEIHWFSF